MQKFYWSNQQQTYSSNDNCKNYKHISCPAQFATDRHSQVINNFNSLTLNINNNPDSHYSSATGASQTNIQPDQVTCVRVKNEPQWKNAENNCHVANSGNKVVLQLGDITIDNNQFITNDHQARTGHADTRQYNRTWNENTKSRYNELLRGRQRKSIQNPNIFQHDYENVYDDNDMVVTDKKCPSSSARNTPRSRKKKKQQQHVGVYRSKSCERVAGVIDRLSEKLSISGLEAEPARAPPTPTPSLLHSKLARAIPCVDIKVVLLLLKLDTLHPCST